MSGTRYGRLTGWIMLAVVGAIAAAYFLDSSRRAALTQTAGWFITAARFALGR
jgi:hypothetical protein